MHKITPTSVPTLDPWGKVADLGAEPIEGELLIFGKMVDGAPTDPVACGYFGVTKGIFRMVYPFNEHAVVVEGRVNLTNETTGESNSYGPGEGWFVKKGTPVLWRVESERFVKNYYAVV